MKTFHIITLGCQMNYTDSARIKAVLINCGFSYEKEKEKADIVIFDTCSVRQKAEDKITGSLMNVRETQKIWITGCMIQHMMKDTRKNKQVKSLGRGNFIGIVRGGDVEVVGLNNDQNRLIYSSENSSRNDMVLINNAYNPMWYNLHETYPNLELFFRIDDTGFLPLILKKLGYENLKYDAEIVNEYEKIIPKENASMNTHKSSAYIPLSTGCNQFCAYCIVPFARGLERNFELEQVVNEAKQTIKNGAKEITLLGQIVNKHPKFVDIIREILRNDGSLKWLRYTSPYPTFYNPELLKLHEEEERLCPHIHIPFQSGSSTILKKMFRGYNAEDCYKFIDNIRALKRDISITTDIIIGFPGETDDDFEETMKLVEYGRFDMIYMGIYSTRPGTFADKQYVDDVPKAVKHIRRKRLNELLKRISRENNKNEIGKIRNVLINEIKNDGELLGYTDNMKQIIIGKGDDYGIGLQKAGNDLIGQILPVKIMQGMEFKLKGDLM